MSIYATSNPRNPRLITGIAPDFEHVWLVYPDDRRISTAKRLHHIDQLTADGGFDEVMEAIENALNLNSAITNIFNAMAAYALVNHYRRASNYVRQNYGEIIAKLIDLDLVWFVTNADGEMQFVYTSTHYDTPYVVEMRDTGILVTVMVHPNFATASFSMHGKAHVVTPIIYAPHGLRHALHIALLHAAVAITIIELQAHGALSD